QGKGTEVVELSCGIGALAVAGLSSDGRLFGLGQLHIDDIALFPCKGTKLEVVGLPGSHIEAVFAVVSPLVQGEDKGRCGSAIGIESQCIRNATDPQVSAAIGRSDKGKPVSRIGAQSCSPDNDAGASHVPAGVGGGGEGVPGVGGCA